MVGAKQNDMIDAFVNWLPGEVDMAEAKILHRFLIQFLKRYLSFTLCPISFDMPQVFKD